MNRPRFSPLLAPFVVVGLLACAQSQDFLAPDEPGPGGASGAGGDAGGGSQGGAGSSAGGSMSGAGGNLAGAGQGGAPGAGQGGASAEGGGSGTAGSGVAGSSGGGASSGAGAGGGNNTAGAGAGQGGQSEGGAGQGGAQGGAAGDGPFGGTGGQPFGGMNTDKICPPLVDGSGGTGGVGIPGGFCAADKLGNPNDDPCYTCWNGSRGGQCKAQFDACDASPDCLKFADCWSSCKNDEDKCFKSCATAFPEGALPYHNVRNCIYLDACPAVCSEQCKGIGSANRCNHDVCTSGYDLDPDCSPCATEVCEADSTCCAFEWDNSCVNKAASICKLDCSNAPLPGCVHSECATGAPLKVGCSACADKVCAKYPMCCAGYGRWDLTCAAAADELCSAP